MSEYFKVASLTVKDGTYKRIINQGNEEGIQFAHINENVMSTDSDNKK
jgi:hypothetical protein